MAANCLRRGVIGSAAMGFPFSRAFTDATVFGDGAGVRLVRPVALVDLHTEDGAVQVLTAGAVDFCFKDLSRHGFDQPHTGVQLLAARPLRGIPEVSGPLSMLSGRQAGTEQANQLVPNLLGISTL